MGQAFFTDNIPPIVKASTTTLTLAATFVGQPTRVTIGGQQYTTSTLTLNTATTGANGLDAGSLGAIQLWYVYAIVNVTTFAVAIIASLTAPSGGPLMPSGYGTAYKLIGAFYTDGSSLVGSTVNITGPALTNMFAYPIAVAGNGSKNFTNKAFMARKADALYVQFSLSSDTTASGSAGATTFTFSMPSGLIIDSTRLGYTAGDSRNYVGSMSIYGITTINVYDRNIEIYPASTTTFAIVKPATGGALTIAEFNNTNQNYLAGDFTVPVVGWTSTLL